jgi:hypothetical protein
MIACISKRVHRGIKRFSSMNLPCPRPAHSLVPKDALGPVSHRSDKKEVSLISAQTSSEEAYNSLPIKDNKRHAFNMAHVHEQGSSK